MSGRLFVIRHGQTGGNKQRYVGWEDVPLDEVGIAQARTVAELLAAEQIDAIYASPLSRAVDTALPLAEARGLTILVREHLKEIDYGHYQGLLKTDQPLKLRHDHRFDAMPGGESLYDVYQRIDRLGTELRPALAAGRSLAVVGHFWSNRMLVGVLSGVPFEDLFVRTQYKPGNGSIYEMTFRPDSNGSAELASTRWIGTAEEAEG